MLGGLLNKMRSGIGKAGAQLTKVDDLERIALAAAGAMFADGKAEDSEYSAAANVMESSFRGVFTRSQIEAALNKAVKLFEGGRFSGRRAVFEACSKVETPEEGQAILACVLDIADAAGGIGDDEMPYIRDIAGRLRVDLKSFGL